MSIYGVAIISGCMFAGNFVGDLLGRLSGIDSNLGSVGFAMLFLILCTNTNLVGSKLSETTVDGLKYWQTMYVPVVVAMTASQNVIQAVSGGTIAILAGFLSVIACFLLLPLLNKIFQFYEVNQESEAVAK